LTREAIEECLTDPKNGEVSRKLMAFCREPKPYGEMGSSGIQGDVFKRLVELKKNGGIAFADGKYFSTELGLEVLKSLE
jgi:hypothetical protein